MSIFRSGVKGLIKVRCVQALSESDYRCEVGQVFEVVSEMKSMLMIRATNGQEILVPRFAFETVAPESEKDQS